MATAGRADETTAIRLPKLLKRQHPNEKPVEHWARMCPVVIPGYGGMNSMEQSDSRERLRERVGRRRKSKRTVIRSRKPGGKMEIPA